MRKNEVFFSSIHEVGDGRAAVGGNSGNWVFEAFDEGWQNLCTVLFLEVFAHVITNLPDAVQSGVSDSWVSVLKVL